MDVIYTLNYYYTLLLVEFDSSPAGLVCDCWRQGFRVAPTLPLLFNVGPQKTLNETHTQNSAPSSLLNPTNQVQIDAYLLIEIEIETRHPSRHAKQLACCEPTVSEQVVVVVAWVGHDRQRARGSACCACSCC